MNTLLQPTYPPNAVIFEFIRIQGFIGDPNLTGCLPDPELGGHLLCEKRPSAGALEGEDLLQGKF